MRNRLRLQMVLAAVLCLTLLPQAGHTGVFLTPNGPCRFLLTFNLQFYGPAADSAFAQRVQNDILHCWSGKRFGCCPVDVAVNFKIGGLRCAGFDSIQVVDDPEGKFISEAGLNGVNGGDSYGTWSSHGAPNVYSHEAGHLAGLTDRYRAEVGVALVGGEFIVVRTATVEPGFENDKMGTLDGQITQPAINQIVIAAGLFCPDTCWASNVAGGTTSGGVQSASAPVTRPSEGPASVQLDFDAFSHFGYLRTADDGGEFVFALMNGNVSLSWLQMPSPTLNPTLPRYQAAFEVPNVFVTIDSFEARPGVSTGPNFLSLAKELVPLNLITPSNGDIVDMGSIPAAAARGGGPTPSGGDGFFQGTMGLKLVNDIFPPQAPAFIETPLFGQIDYATGAGFVALDLAPFFFVDLSEVPGSERTARTILLAHNVPNPVRFSTHIRFRAAERGRAKLRIFDVAGRLVRTLVDGEIVPGTYNLLWDRRTDAGAKAGAGVYFYRLEMSGERQTRRMVVVP